ncbi:MAG: hypothetical protein V4477_16975 [Pseudomonadota bacterium]
MIADRGASQVESRTGTYPGLNRGVSRIWVKLPSDTYEQIKALALATNRTISSQTRELINQSLEPK